MKVLVVPSWYSTKLNPLSGVFFKEQFIALSKLGVEVTVLYPELYNVRNINIDILKSDIFKISKENEIDVFRKTGFIIHPRIPYIEERFFQKYLFDLYKRYKEKNGKPDLIHAHSLIWAGVSSVNLGEMENIPVVITEHSSIFGLKKINNRKRKLADLAISKANQVIAVSSQLKKELLNYFPEANIKVIPNMVDTDYFNENELIKPTSVFFTFLTVSSLTYNKGHDLLLKAFAAAFSKDKRTILKVVGKGSYLKHLRNIVREVGIEDQVFFLGELDRHEIRNEYNMSDAFVLASRYETFGVVYIEALSCGNPVIATDCGGPIDIVDQDNGILIPPNDLNSLINALKSMRVNFSKFDKNQIRRSVGKFSRENIANKILDLYNETLSVKSERNYNE